MRPYAGRALHIDLTSQRSSVLDLPDALLEGYLGGAGLASRLLLDLTPAGAGPLGPDNALVFAAGAFAGTPVPAGAKYALATRSPLTGFIGDSLSSSYFALAIRAAGFDAIAITGALERPSYIVVDDGAVTFHDAAHLWGMGCAETEAAVQAEAGGGKLRVASIGPAGEHRVRYACVGNDKGRQAGRTGPGAVFGAKGLKALALHGTHTTTAADPVGLQQAAALLGRKLLGPATEKYRVLGTNANMAVLNRMGLLPTRNFQASAFAGAAEIGAEQAKERHGERRASCAGCPVGCDHIAIINEGPLAGAKGSGEYESVYALGACCGIDDFPTVIRAIQLCDELGLDTISAGVTAAWAMECVEQGILTRAGCDGLDLRFGNGAALLELLPRIARREGIGDLLAEGSRRAAAIVGRGSGAFAMHVKGLELPGYDPRGMHTYALGLAVSTRGACHNRSAAYEPDLRGTVDRFSAGAARGRLAMEQEDYAAVFDSLALCKFIRGAFADPYAEMAELYRLATGRETDAAALRQAGERICTTKKAYNMREGWTAADDWLPPRLFAPSDDGRGHHDTLRPDDLRMMIDAYYAARGWWPDGTIPPERLAALGITSDALPSS